MTLVTLQLVFDLTSILVIIGSLIILFIGIVLQKFFDFSIGEIGSKIMKKYRQSSEGLRVDVLDCTHILKNGKNLVEIRLEFSNDTKITTRIDSISIFNKKGTRLQSISRGQSGPAYTQFDLRGEQTIPWSYFYEENQSVGADTIKLKLVVERRNGKTVKKKLQSVLVDEGKFSTGDFFIAF